MIKSKELQNIISFGDEVTFEFEKISRSMMARKGVWRFAGYEFCNVDCNCCDWCKGRMKFVQNIPSTWASKSFSECFIYILPGDRFSPVVLQKLHFHLENVLFEI